MEPVNGACQAKNVIFLGTYLVPTVPVVLCTENKANRVQEKCWLPYLPWYSSTMKSENKPEKVTRYRHTCFRCGHTFISASKTPVCCGHCKSPYWNRARRG